MDRPASTHRRAVVQWALSAVVAMFAAFSVGLHSSSVLLASDPTDVGISEGAYDDERADLDERLEELESRIEELESDLREAKETLDDARTETIDVRGEVDRLTREVADLEDAISDFDYYDWQSVVPNVADSADELRRRASNLDQALSSLELALGS